jgi:hypothetical protein
MEAAQARKDHVVVAPGRASAADAFSGDPSHAALASFAAGGAQATLLLPLNTLQTHMQHHGRPIFATVHSIFAKGGSSGLRLLYRAWIPTIGMLGARQVMQPPLLPSGRAHAHRSVIRALLLLGRHSPVPATSPLPMPHRAAHASHPL